MSDSKPIEVAIVGAGLSGLAVANGLINDPQKRYNVTVYERDTIAFDSDRGGYQIRVSENGLCTLKKVLDANSWQLLRTMWGSDSARAPTIVNPANFEVVQDLAKLKLYPASLPIARTGLRRALLELPLAQNRVKFGHRLERFEDGNDSGVDLHFFGGINAHADLVIAADGSKSVITAQIGLGNRKKLDDWMLLQARGTVSDEVYQALPKALTEAQAIVFMAGRSLYGYAALYRDVVKHDSGAELDAYTVFWSLMIPSTVGTRLLEKASGDNDVAIDLLCEYIRESLGSSEALPTIISNVRTHLRTGFLTSSDRPTGDWRAASSAAARVIPIGDAIHPMTPGRGMGANQAFVDAGMLVSLLRDETIVRETLSDEVLMDLGRKFDAEMYPRAFKMVKGSEDMTDLDLTRVSGRMKVYVEAAILTVLGWGVSALESLGLRRPARLDIDSQEL